MIILLKIFILKNENIILSLTVTSEPIIEMIMNKIIRFTKIT